MNTIFKLGKKAPINKDSVPFGKFVTLLPNVPLVDTPPNYTFPMDLNDQYGDCVVAGWDHARQVITGLLKGTPENFTTTEIEAFYKTQNPGFPEEDNGMDIQTFLEYLQENKYIVGFAKIDHTNEAELKAAIYMGLAIITGVQLDQEQMAQYETGVWDYVPNGTLDGGHCIPQIAYQASPDQLTCVTWGKPIQETIDFIKNQMDEAWFILLQEHIDHPTFRTHFDLAAFSQSVREITEGKIIIPVPVIADQVDIPLGTTSIQESTVDLIYTFEGFKPYPYEDSGGVWTIGIGFTHINGVPVTKETPQMTLDQAKVILKTQLETYADAINAVLKVPLTQNQFDACCSLCYNIGVAGFSESTICRDINADNFQGAADAFLLWDKVNGVVSEGLLNRRKKERELFLS